MPKTRRELCESENCNVTDVIDVFENRLWYSQLEVNELKRRLLELPNFVYEDNGVIIKTHDFIKKAFKELSGGWR